jgi:hypothetical protein
VRREHKFTMMFSDDEWTKLCELAGAQGMSLSTFLRRPLYLESTPAPLASTSRTMASLQRRKQNGTNR